MEKPLYYCNVRFGRSLASKEYQYKTYLSDLVEGDHIVVQAGGDWNVAYFVKYLTKCTMMEYFGDERKPIPAPQAVKYIVAKIDDETAKALWS